MPRYLDPQKSWKPATRSNGRLTRMKALITHPPLLTVALSKRGSANERRKRFDGISTNAHRHHATVRLKPRMATANAKAPTGNSMSGPRQTSTAVRMMSCTIYSDGDHAQNELYQAHRREGIDKPNLEDGGAVQGRLNIVGPEGLADWNE